MAAYDLPNINSASHPPTIASLLCFSTHSLSFILPFCLGSYANANKTIVTVSNGIHPSLSIKGTGPCFIEKKTTFWYVFEVIDLEFGKVLAQAEEIWLLTSGILCLFGQLTQGSSESGVCRLGNSVPIG